jgi:hypothetical protein
MKTTIELTPDNAAALAKYAALAGDTPAEFLNRYLEGNMVPLFENPKSGELESHLATLEYRTQADAGRVVAWMEERVNRTLEWRTSFGAEIFEDLETGCFWIETTATAQ